MAPRVSGVPVLVQPYVEKAYELRVTAVGDRLFTCRIDSQGSRRTATDWRLYDFANTPHSVETLDTATEGAIQALLKTAELTFAAIDMIVNREGEVIFVEMNPSGQFGWLESLVNPRIHEAIVDWLLEP